MAADQGIKRVVVPRSELPAVNIVDDPGNVSTKKMIYFFRYRISSEDKNRFSHWSPAYRVVLPAMDGSGITKKTTNSSPGIRTTVWTLPTRLSNLTQFDIYYRYDQEVNPDNTEKWTFGGTISATTFSNVIPDSVGFYEIAVQIPTNPKIRYAPATLFIDSI